MTGNEAVQVHIDEDSPEGKGLKSVVSDVLPCRADDHGMLFMVLVANFRNPPIAPPLKAAFPQAFTSDTDFTVIHIFDFGFGDVAVANHYEVDMETFTVTSE